MICLSSTTVVFSAEFSIAGGFQTLEFSMPFVFARALIDFLFSFSIQIACFSLKVSSHIFILVCVCHHRMQDSKYRSNGHNWYDTFPAFNTWRINATGHSWSLRKFWGNCSNTYAHIRQWMKLEKCWSSQLVKHLRVESPNNNNYLLNHICKCLDSTANRAILSLLFQYFWRALYMNMHLYHTNIYIFLIMRNTNIH